MARDAAKGLARHFSVDIKVNRRESAEETERQAGRMPHEETVERHKDKDAESRKSSERLPVVECSKDDRTWRSRED